MKLAPVCESRVAMSTKDCLAPVNDIVRENCKSGHPATEWDINAAGSSLTLELSRTMVFEMERADGESR